MSAISGNSSHEEDFSVDITDCVQAIADGATNNGIMVSVKIASDQGTARNLSWYGFESPSNLAKAGWLEVKYITKRPVSNFPGGKKWAFVFQTDDARKTANDAYTSEFVAHGGKYTIYATKDYLRGTGIASESDLLAWYNAGMEIGAHSRHHIAATAYRLSYDANGYAAADTTNYSAGWDSMKVSLKPAWMYALGDSLGIDRASRRWAKSMALPENEWSPWTTKLCAMLGYSTVRCGQSGYYGNLPSVGMGRAYADTAFCGLPSQLGRAPRNVMMLPTWFGIESVVGAKANTTISEAEVKANFTKLVEQTLADGRNVVSLFVHDFKTDPSGASYNEGLDREELDWMLDIVDAKGGCYMTATEYGDWLRANGTAIDTPAAYGQVDPFNYTAADRVWYKPNGIDNRWLRNVR
jgi:hypothetical protein